MTEHVVIQDPQIHEPKGVSTATSGQVYVADGVGGGAWVNHLAGTIKQGIYDYHDVTTQSSPIALTLADTDYELTNDAAGTQTYKSPLVGLSEMWDENTDRFIWNNGDVLAIGDSVDIRLDVEVTTTTVNTAVTITLELDPDDLAVRIPLIPETNFKDSGVHPQIRFMGIYMGSTEILTGGARIIASADSTGVTIKVNGWYVRALHSEGV